MTGYSAIVGIAKVESFWVQTTLDVGTTGVNDVFLFESYITVNDVELRSLDDILLPTQYYTDLILNKISTLPYSLDTSITGGGFNVFPIDLIIKRNDITETNDIDTHIIKVSTLPCLLDVLQQKSNLTKLYSTDTLIQKLDISTVNDVDTRLVKILTSSYSLDAMLQKTVGGDPIVLGTNDVVLYKSYTNVNDAILRYLGEDVLGPTQYIMDNIFKRFDIGNLNNVDVLIQKLNIISNNIIDVWLKRLDITEQYSVDAVLKKFDITKTKSLDVAILMRDIMRGNDIDLILQRLDIKFPVNTHELIGGYS